MEAGRVPTIGYLCSSEKKEASREAELRKQQTPTAVKKNINTRAVQRTKREERGSSDTLITKDYYVRLTQFWAII